MKIQKFAKFFIRNTALLAVCALATALALPANVCLAADAVVSVDNGDTTELYPGDSATLSIRVTDIPDNLGAFDFNISWNSSVIEVDDISSGSGVSLFTANIGTSSASIAGLYVPAVTSNVTVASLSITAIGNVGDSTSVNVSVSKLIDQDNGGISRDTLNATVSIIEEPPPPEKHTLSIGVLGNGTTDPSIGNHSYNEDRVITIEAIPDEGWYFVNWTGSVADPDSAKTTVKMTTDKTIVANFAMEDDDTPPIITGATNKNTTQTSVEIHWKTNEPSTSQVEYWASPSTFTPIDETLTTDHIVSINGLTPATTYTYKTISIDSSGNVTISEEMTFSTEGLPATFVISDFNISLGDAEGGKSLDVTFTLSNIGNLSGEREVTLEVNGSVQETKNFQMEAGASETVSFNVSKNAPGTYGITVEGISASFVVPQSSSAASSSDGGSEGLPIWIFIALAGLMAAIAAVLLIQNMRLRKSPVSAQKPKPITYDKYVVQRQREKLPGKTEEDKITQEATVTHETAFKPTAELSSSAADDTVVDIDGGKLKVTASAIEKLRNILDAQTTDSSVSIRLIPSAAGEGTPQFEMTLDTRDSDDIAVKSGVRVVLIINKRHTEAVLDKTIDYKQTDGKARFTIS